ncbi:aspartate-semialdehyde dehydrogenase [Paracrocinitomix mangrovi]|uniref:aspartate-semialdehyde dehydrogenase n=1 Tax=Paracrocinitomix mangrovi TaxID=2862509 RepID=UPI001C8D00E4|nr:aspartate-semialdehyde dehydrogenase [Paracrocinitomix mangrovi]UKN00857.1 aspartate-semialdehyde dehydrogenase [Paracrocinitomix mangrovi]
MKIAVVGATGLVGGEILDVVEEYNLPVDELLIVASKRSVGKTLTYKGNTYKIISIEDAIEQKPEIAIFSAGGSTSLEWAPKFAEVGTTVIDNSSAWRMSPDHKLIVPEINADLITENDKIIANPNCSTIQMVMVLAPLHKKYKIKRVVVSTYQSISGTGMKAITQMENEMNEREGEMAYPYPIVGNCLPHCDVFEDNGYTKEEMKLTNETKKILDPSIQVTATAVRVPVSGGHSESVNIEFENDFDLSEVRRLLHEMDGVVVQDNPDTNTYPMPLYAKGKNDVFVGRIRRDETQANTLNLWIVADNLRKGAATNAVQIAKYIIEKHLISA